MSQRRGSITIFSALSMMLVASLILALLEAARVQGLDYYAKKQTEAGVESACAEYQPLLWQDYHILVLDGGYGKGNFSIENVNDRIQYYTERNLKQDRTLLNLLGVDLFRVQEEEILAREYLLLTDGNGEVFLNLISETMKETLPEVAAQEIYERYQEGKAVEEDGSDVTEETAKAEEYTKEITPELSDEQWEDKTSFKENLSTALEAKKTLEKVSKLQESGWLNMVLDEKVQISQKSIDLSNSVEKRERNQGTEKVTEQADWYRKVLVLEYLENYYSCYLTTASDRAFSYEMEYLIGGKESEADNLESVVKRLIAIREAANIAYILGNKEMTAIAEGIGIAISAFFSGSQAVTKAVKAAIIGAWAFLESVLDVRTLLSGGRISLLKSDEEWTTDVGNIVDSFQKAARAKECEDGLCYQDYLKQILFFMGNQKLAYRMMNVMEQNLWQREEFRNCRMDQMLVKMQYQISYTAEPLFSQMTTIGKRYKGKYHFQKETMFSYIP